MRVRTDLSKAGPKPWEWSKVWARNEVAFIKFLWPLLLSLNMVASVAQIGKTAAASCRSPRKLWATLRHPPPPPPPRLLTAFKPALLGAGQSCS